MAAAAARTRRASEALRPAADNRLEIRSEPGKGRGVFATGPIEAGTLLESAPVIVVPPEQCALLDRTILHDYYFDWNGGVGAVALGLVSLCNHSRRPSARVRRNLAQSALDLVALTPIAAGDEVTIDYNCPLWFDPCE
jgi:SET domain-containing protein